MSKEEEARDEFFEYLLALDSISRDDKFSSPIEPLEDNFWSNLEKDIEEEEKESRVFLDRSGITISKNKPSIQDSAVELEQKVQELEQKVQELENHVHLVMRGPKGDKGEDGADGESIKLTEEDIKNAVRKGVEEGLEEQRMSIAGLLMNLPER